MEIQYLLYNNKIWVLIKNPLDHIIKGVFIMYHVKNYDLAISPALVRLNLATAGPINS